MALIDELKYKLKSVEQRIDEKHTQIREIGSILEVEEAYRNDLDRAIAALTPQHAPDHTAAVAEPETTPGAYRVTYEHDYQRAVDVFETMRAAESRFEEMRKDLPSGARLALDILYEGEHGEREWVLHQLTYGSIGPDGASDAEPEIPESEPAEFISDLTGNPAIEPETGLHGDPVLRAFEDDQIVAPAWIDEQTCEPINPHVEAEGYAPVVAADEPEPEPSLLDRFNPFRVKADA